MSEIIVYRNPLEASVWQMLMSAEFIVAFVGVVVFLVVFVASHMISVRVWGHRGKRSALRTNLCLLIGFLASVSSVFMMA